MSAVTTREFGPEVTEVSAARRFVAAAVVGWGLAPHDIALVVSELAANAVVHARSGFTVSVIRTNRSTVIVEITDDDPRVPVPGTPSPWATGGRGLLIVERLTTTWGIRPASTGGKVIWAELQDCGQT